MSKTVTLAHGDGDDIEVADVTMGAHLGLSVAWGPNEPPRFGAIYPLLLSFPIRVFLNHKPFGVHFGTKVLVRLSVGQILGADDTLGDSVPSLGGLRFRV